MFKIGLFPFGPSAATETVIGTQTWATKNLNVTSYRNGDPINHATTAAEWETYATAGQGCYASVNFDSSNDAVYGKLYNGYALKDSRQIAPIGWHVPTEEEYLLLTEYLTANTLTGGDLKEVGLDHWASPNTGATDSTGFKGVPSGYMNYNPPSTTTVNTTLFGYHAITDLTTNHKYFYLSNVDNSITNDLESSLDFGYPIRCIKNESLIIGQRFGGGVIYNLQGDPNADSYEVRLVYFDGSTIIIGTDLWGCDGTPTGASSSEDGYTNTQTVLANSCGSAGFTVCDGNTFLINYNDWFVPAADTLQAILNLDYASTIQLNVSTTDIFWSSTEDNNDPDFSAVRVRFNSPTWETNVVLKSSNLNFTLIRIQYI